MHTIAKTENVCSKMLPKRQHSGFHEFQTSENVAKKATFTGPGTIELKTFFATKEEGKMDEYVGCQIKQINKDCLIMHQMELVRKLERIFHDDIEALKNRKILLGTNQGIIRPKKGENLISKEERTKYCSGIGMLLYLVKYSRPDLSNAVRELLKLNDGATKEHVQNLL